MERGNGLHDVASILQRRVAVEFSDSDSESESEYDSEGWGENETSAWHRRKASTASQVYWGWPQRKKEVSENELQFTH